MVRYSKHSLSRLEDIFKALNIQVRYEKGNFQSGYCLVAGKNMVIVNKFFDTEARMNTLLEILEDQQPDLSVLPADELEWLGRVRRSALKEA